MPVSIKDIRTGTRIALQGAKRGTVIPRVNKVLSDYFSCSESVICLARVHFVHLAEW